MDGGLISIFACACLCRPVHHPLDRLAVLTKAQLTNDVKLFFASSETRHLSRGLTKLARDCLLPGMDDQAAFVRDAVSSAMDALPQLGKEDFDMPQSAWQ